MTDRRGRGGTAPAMSFVPDHFPTRRQFLQQTSALAGLALGLPVRPAPAALPSTTQAATAPSVPSRVVDVCNDRLVSARTIHPHILAEMIDQALRSLTDQPTLADAWRSLLRDDDIIALKFNDSGAQAIATTPVLAQVLFQGLLDAGFRPDQIVPIELSQDVLLDHKTLPPAEGWTSHVYDFGSGKDALAAVVEQATAIINVPFLKTHNIAGMSGCLKNLSHALVRHPAWFHGNGCDPYVADIVALPAIRQKLRLHLVNALRIVVDNGPQAQEKDIHPAASLLASLDPVAADTVGQDMLDALRLQRGLPRLASDAGKLPILVSAARRGLGMDDPDALDYIKIRT
jgi:hypothetical protein